jgi:hypothetical protein
MGVHPLSMHELIKQAVYCMQQLPIYNEREIYSNKEYI